MSLMLNVKYMEYCATVNLMFRKCGESSASLSKHVALLKHIQLYHRHICSLSGIQITPCPKTEVEDI